MKRFVLTTLLACILMTVQARAEITPQLLYEWQKQPTNVQWNVYYQNTNIQVVDNLDWQSQNLYDTWAYTRMNVKNMQVYSIDMRIKRGYEHTLSFIPKIKEDIERLNNKKK